MSALAELVIHQSVNRLRHVYRPKLHRCLTELDETQIWQRPNDVSNSVGNLVLHLAGNLRQWVVAGIGGEEDVRDRPSEFAAAGEVDRAGLLEILDAAIYDACRVIEGLDDEALCRRLTIQTYWVTTYSALFHAVEHFAGHVGQIIWITKMARGKDMTFYGF